MTSDRPRFITEPTPLEGEYLRWLIIEEPVCFRLLRINSRPLIAHRFRQIYLSLAFHSAAKLLVVAFVESRFERIPPSSNAWQTSTLQLLFHPLLDQSWSNTLQPTRRFELCIERPVFRNAALESSISFSLSLSLSLSFFLSVFSQRFCRTSFRFIRLLGSIGASLIDSFVTRHARQMKSLWNYFIPRKSETEREKERGREIFDYRIDVVSAINRGIDGTANCK